MHTLLHKHRQTLSLSLILPFILHWCALTRSSRANCLWIAENWQQFYNLLICFNEIKKWIRKQPLTNLCDTFLSLSFSNGEFWMVLLDRVKVTERQHLHDTQSTRQKCVFNWKKKWNKNSQLMRRRHRHGKNLSHAHSSDDFKIACASYTHSRTHTSLYFIWQSSFIYCCCSFQIGESVFGRVFYGDGDNDNDNDNNVVCLVNALERASEQNKAQHNSRMKSQDVEHLSSIH